MSLLHGLTRMGLDSDLNTHWVRSNLNLGTNRAISSYGEDWECCLLLVKLPEHVRTLQKIWWMV